MRTELVLSFLFLFVMILIGLRLGWRNRGRRQAFLPELPVAPAELGTELAPAFDGLYLGTTTSLHWQDRIVAHGLGERANVHASLTTAGVLIDRAGREPLFIPNAALLDARLEAAIAGKVVGRGGILVLRWHHGDTDLDTGLRADDRASYVAWIQAITARASSSDSGAAQ
jgi:hypothetical protein